MSFRIRNGFPAVIVLTISAMMVLMPTGMTVHASTCAGGLNPNLRITLLVPSSNPARIAWAAIVQNSLQCLGMDVASSQVPFSPNIYDRALTPSISNVGKTYDQGGFDILFVGYNLLIDPDPYSLYHSSQFSCTPAVCPNGQNYYLWNSTQNDQLTNLIKTTLDRNTRLDYVKQWQVLASNELPSIPIFYTKEIVAFGNQYPNAQQVFNVYHFPAWAPIEHLSASGTSSFILAETGQAPGQGIVPELSTSYYDLAVSSEIFGSLALRNDTIFKTMIPQLASGTPSAPGWTSSPDGKTWNVTLRSGVTWQDGKPFNAADVKFTFDLYQNSTFASPTGAFVKGIVGGKNNVTTTGPMSIMFKLPAPYAYFAQNILTTPILPAHILNNATFYSGGTIDYSTIKNSLFNRPDSGTFGSLPIGTGPYKYSDYTAATTTNHLVRNDAYFDFSDWGRSALLAKGQFQIKDYYVRTIVGVQQAVTALSNGEVNFLDSQYHLETQTSFLSSWPASQQTSYGAYGVQEMGVNMEHPILGTGTATPHAQQYPGNATAAANAARWIRQAISYAVPRNLIVGSLLHGYGSPAITTPIIGDSATKTAVTDGFNTDLSPYPYDLTKAAQLLAQAGYQQTSSPTSFFNQYGIYIIVAIVVAAVAVAATFLLRARRSTGAGAMSTSTTTPPPPPPPATTP
jgi:ABC-type transport system substrate-binding protein